MTNDPLDSNMFVELAKAKKMPQPKMLKIENISPNPITDDEEGQLTIDVYKDKDDIIVESAIAGINPDDLEINITEESVTIRGKRAKEKTISEKDYYYQECFWGSFSRSIVLPQEIDPEKSVANFENGILTIRMPKLTRGKGKKIKVKAA